MNPMDLVAKLRLATLRSTLSQQHHRTPRLPSTAHRTLKGQRNPRRELARLTTPTFSPRRLLNELKETPRDLSGGSGVDECVANSGASYHVTWDPTGIIDCKPSGKSVEVSDK